MNGQPPDDRCIRSVSRVLNMGRWWVVSIDVLRHDTMCFLMVREGVSVILVQARNTHG